MKIVFLIALISSPPSDLWPHFKLCAKQVVMELGQPLSGGTSVRGEVENGTYC